MNDSFGNMKHLVSSILLFFCFGCLYSQAQRVNADGRKLVKTLRTTVIDRWGKESWPWFNRTYAFEYESDGRLQKVTRQWIDEGDKNFETLERNEEGYHYNHLVNGRSIPKLKVEYVMNREGYIRSVIEDVKEAHETWRTDSIGWTYLRTATVYSRNCKVLTFDFIGSKPREEEWNDGYLTQNFTFSRKKLPSFDRFNEDDFKDMGMDGYVLEFLSRDSVSYSLLFTNSDFYNNIKGNLIRVPCPYNRETIYLNDKNDINLFLWPLSHICVLSHYYNNIEAVTEWIGFSSKNLIEYENRSPTGKYYDAHWIYERDSNDNIVKIIIERPNDLASKIILDLEYVM